jgi:hypothetical protein
MGAAATAYFSTLRSHDAQMNVSLDSDVPTNVLAHPEGTQINDQARATPTLTAQPVLTGAATG